MYKIRMAIVLFLVFCLLGAGEIFAAEQEVFIHAPSYSVDSLPDGTQRISMPGYFMYGEPGFPALPAKIVKIALPPEVDPHSIRIVFDTAQVLALGKHSIAELPPMGTWEEGQQTIVERAYLYDQNDFFPGNPVEYLGYARMRRWRIAILKYTPFQYNPVSAQLRFVPSVSVTINYSLLPKASLPQPEVVDTVMDKRASTSLMNYEEAKNWYTSSQLESRPAAVYDYVIITTNAIESTSTQLSSYVSFLSSRGNSPLVVTEDEYGGLTGQSPNGTAEKIRQWLINNYVSYSIEYVLLIGNPNPSGDVPMKMCWPRWTESTYRESPTDYFYADLTGNWDLDGDGYFGEWPDDNGTGGVDFSNEVYVGRIPVYSGVTNLDSVLVKSMNYADSGDISWRQSTMLPMSFSDSTTDGAYLSEAMKSNYLASAGFSSWTLYMQGTLCAGGNSSFSSDQELVDGATKTNWMNNPYGMVWWWGHGSSTSAALGYTGCGWGTIMSSSDSSSLNDAYPSFVYQCSCNNGYPETSSNLGTVLLYNGAIGTVSASRVSWYAVTSWYTGLKYYCDNASIGYYYGQELVSNAKMAANALYDVKSDMGANHFTSWGGCHWMNLFDFNLYGDPTRALNDQALPHTVSTPETPTGPSSGSVNTGYTFSSSGASCSGGHAVEYRFDWGDGSYSGWLSTPSSGHSWATPSTYSVRAQARCAVSPAILSDWSGIKTITISAAVNYTLTMTAGSGGTTEPSPGPHSYSSGTGVEITAIPDYGFRFTHWSGDIPAGSENTNPVTVTMDGARSIAANFAAIIWSAAGRLTWNSGESASPVIAVDSAGNLYSVWQDDTSGNFALYFKKSVDGGVAWSSIKRLTWGTGDALSPAICVGASGILYVACQDDTSGDNEIYYLSSTDGGTTWSTVKRLTWNSSASEAPDVALNSSGHVFIAWQDDTSGSDQVYWKKSTDAGASWSSALRLTWCTGNATAPSIAVGGSDRLHITWADDTSGSGGIIYKTSGDGGGTWDITSRLSYQAGFAVAPEVAGSAAGDVHVVWKDSSAGSEGLYFKLSQDSGSSWSGQRLTWNPASVGAPALALGSSGIFVVWSDSSYANSEICLKYGPDGEHWHTQRLTWSSGSSDSPSVCVHPSGSVHFIWSDDTNTNFEIYLKRGY